MMIVACVRTGTKYSVEYVHRLRAGVKRHLKGRPYRFVVLTDKPEDLPGYDTETAQFPKWFAKLELFKTPWRDDRVIYLDLDTVITGDLGPLADLTCNFGICENFTRLAGKTDWPCRYGSCVMTIAPDFGEHIWKAFQRDPQAYMNHYELLGDQAFIEAFVPKATLLQRVLPEGYFMGYRDLPKHKEPPKECSLVIFAGRHKPDNTECKWAAEQWAA